MCAWNINTPSLPNSKHSRDKLSRTIYELFSKCAESSLESSLESSFSGTLLEIYFGGDKCRNFDHFAHLVPKYISAEIYLRRIFISAEYLSPPKYISAEYISPPNINLGRIFFPFFSFSITINYKVLQ